MTTKRNEPITLPPSHRWDAHQDIESRSFSPDYWRGWNAYHDKAVDAVKQFCARLADAIDVADRKKQESIHNLQETSYWSARLDALYALVEVPDAG